MATQPADPRVTTAVPQRSASFRTAASGSLVTGSGMAARRGAKRGRGGGDDASEGIVIQGRRSRPAASRPACGLFSSERTFSARCVEPSEVLPGLILVAKHGGDIPRGEELVQITPEVPHHLRRFGSVG